MTKHVITEKFLEECPNCGAASVGEEEICKFCGTSLVQRVRVKEYEIAENDPEVVITGVTNGVGEKADITSGVKPSAWGDTVRMVYYAVAALLIVAAVAFLLMSIEGKKKYKEHLNNRSTETLQSFLLYGEQTLLEAERKDYIMWGKMAGAMTCFAIVMLVIAAVPVIRYRRVLDKGTEYDAEVLSCRMVINSADNYTNRIGSVKMYLRVKAVMDGKDTVISLPMPDGHSTKEFPTGQKVKIRVLGTGVALSEQ